MTKPSPSPPPSSPLDVTTASLGRTLRRLVAAAACLTLVGLASPAGAQANAQAFVEQEHGRLAALMKQPASPTRDTTISSELDRMVDYDALARRTFGLPCPPRVSQCQNHWDSLTGDQKKEVTELLRRLVARNYKKNLRKTLDYEVTYKGARAAGDDTTIRTEAKSKTKPRESPVTVDYIVSSASGGFKVVDIRTEGSSLAKNYYQQFHRMLTTPGQGYPHVTKRLRDKIAEP
ncbi:MAG: ABC transporter substrate-binding protein [Myxococcales bacterium]|nr:ABC transporter substrate-binding protein [Myxococcales bacterium]HQY64225.1 ABC transporter substrate-binding protein [Polyangiaceae bacterium]